LGLFSSSSQTQAAEKVLGWKEEGRRARARNQTFFTEKALSLASPISAYKQRREITNASSPFSLKSHDPQKK
jgi:hypothetical protein